MYEKAMVFTVLDKAVDVVLIRLGYKKRLYTDVCIHVINHNNDVYIHGIMMMCICYINVAKVLQFSVV